MIPLVLLVVAAVLVLAVSLAPGLTVLAMIALVVRAAVRRRRHRFDTFISAMLS